MDLTKQPDNSGQPDSQSEEQKKKDFYYNNLHLKGLGGWLIIVQLCLWLLLLNACINVVFVTLPKVIQFSKYEGFGWMLLIPFQFIGALLIVAALLILLAQFVRKSSRFPVWFIGFNIGLAVFYLIDFGLNLLLFEMSDETMFTYISAFMRQALLSVLWIAYMVRSKRVKVTFIH